MWNINPISSDSLVTLSLTIIALIAVSWRYYLQRHRGTAVKGRLLPGPRGVPLLGYLPFLGRDLHRQFAGLAPIHGPIFKLWLGNKLFVVVTSPEIVREIARDKDVVFANHELSVAGAISTKGGKDIAFSPHGRVWRKLRRIFVQQVMSAAAIEGLRRQRSEAVRESIQRLHRSSSIDGIDVGHVAFLTSANSVLRMMWGGSMDAVQEGAEELRRAVWEILFLVGKPNVSDVFPSLAWLDLQGIGRETVRLTAVFERMFDSAIEKRRKKVNAEDDDDFLQFLLEFVDDDKGEDSETSITMNQLKATLMDPVVGGTQTTSTVVEWAMAELLKNKETIMRKAQDELTQIVGLTNMVEESHLSKLVYLQAVIKETLRLHPPFPLMVPRFPSENTSLAGFTIPKKATIFVNAWAIHRNPSVWEDPLEFKPERFLLANDDGKFDYNGNNDFNYIPFGVGRRICPGIPMAEKMVPLALASFLHCFNWKLPPCIDPLDLDFSDKFGLVTTVLKPVVAIPTPRLSNLDLYA